jgi:hypothetical protein
MAHGGGARLVEREGGEERGTHEQRHLACPLSTGEGTRRVRIVRGKGRGVSA